MIDGSNPDPAPEEPRSGPRRQQGGASPQQRPDLYADLFGQTANRDPSGTAPPSTPPPQQPAQQAPPAQSGSRSPATPPPLSPATLEESGLTLMQLCELVLKQLYLQGNLLGLQISRQARLPFHIVNEALHLLKDEKCIEVASGSMIGPASYRFNLTELGRRRARETFEQCRYVGPAPVPLEAYIRQCRQQAVTGTSCSPEALRQAFSELIVRPGLLEELGPAVCSGKSIFIYGPPGNGKTLIAKGLGKFLNNYGGEIYIPYAVHTEGNIITFFDPTIHQTTDDEELRQRQRDTGQSQSGSGVDARTEHDPHTPDLRWRRIRRPVVITGGELTLEMLDLRYNKTSNLYTAPLHIKANGGVFLIDDFGRQLVSPRDLLNRWILPLEERNDYLSLATGKKFAIPFEQLIIFSTNLDPRELVDEAFLRRIRHKIHIGPPERELFAEIFRFCCDQKQIPFNQDAVDYLYSHFYDNGKPPRCSDARDLLEIVQSICRFRNQQIVLTPELLAEATERFFCQV